MNDFDQAILDASFDNDDFDEEHDVNCPRSGDGAVCTCESLEANDA